MATTVEKGITITFRGDTTQFDKGISTINGELKTLKSDMKLLNRELKLDPTNIDKLSQKFKALQNQEKLIKEEIDSYKQAMKGLDSSSEEFKKMSDKVRGLQVDLEYCRKEMDKLGGNQMSVVLNGLSDKFEKIGSSVTKLGNSLAPLSAVASGVLASFGKLSVDTVRTADDINTLAKQTNLSTDTLQIFGQMADLIDVDLKSLSKSALTVTKNLDNKNALSTWEKLGVSVKDSTGSYRNVEDILFDTVSALQKIEDETERSILANEVFGKSYSNLGSILNDTTFDLNELRSQVDANGVILSSDELNALNDINDDLDTFKMTLSGIGTSIVADLKEPLKSVTSSLTTLATKIKEVVSAMSPQTKETILKIISAIAIASPILLAVGTAISTISKVLGTISTVLNVLFPVIQAIGTFLATANPIGLVVTGLAILIPLFMTLYERCEGFRDIINKIGSFLRDVFTGAVQGVSDAISSLCQWFKDTWSAVGDLWNKMQQTEFIRNLTGAFESLRDTLMSVVEWLKSTFDWLGSVVEKVGDFFASGISSVGDFIGGIFDSGGFGNNGAYQSGGYGTLEFATTINITNNGANLTSAEAQRFGRQIVEYVNEKLGRRV